MNTLLDAMIDATNYTYTENGALTHKTTRSGLLDMFAMGGSMRNRFDADIILMFQKAYAEDSIYALKCLFYLRDIEEGQGERRFFRTCIHWLADQDSEAAKRNLRYIPLFGRWDDLYAFVGTKLEKEAFDFMKEQLSLDILSKTPSLLAKWLKSENTSSKESRALGHKTREAFGMTHKQYRKTLSLLRERINIVERLMSENRWGEIEFNKIPSRAGLIYRNAFARHDIERLAQNDEAQSYKDFITDDTKKVNAKVLNPVDIANEIIYEGYSMDEIERAALDKYWNNLKDYYNGREETGIAICDVSGSMMGQPLSAAVSMSAYIAERGKGPFKDHFITFSNDPKLVKFEGVDVFDKFKRAITAEWGGSTNVEAAMNLILNTAVNNNVPAEDMPEVLYIFSDMEFNYCLKCGEPSKDLWGHRSKDIENPETFFESLEKRWEECGYKLPRVIFWNLDARQENIPALGNRFSYVSGFSLNMMEAIFSGKDGIALMYEKLDSPRYEVIG